MSNRKKIHFEKIRVLWHLCALEIVLFLRHFSYIGARDRVLGCTVHAAPWSLTYTLQTSPSGCRFSGTGSNTRHSHRSKPWAYEAGLRERQCLKQPAKPQRQMPMAGLLLCFTTPCFIPGQKYLESVRMRQCIWRVVLASYATSDQHHGGRPGNVRHSSEISSPGMHILLHQLGLQQAVYWFPCTQSRDNKKIYI